MQMNDYQQAALATARSKDADNELFHLLLGLVGESGELAEKFKKLVRDHNSQISELDMADITKELGDILWYIAVLADFLGISLDDIASKNIKKLQDRKARGKISGVGDNR
jgi:NTP pyrophosphatase (non-canonical NTP hydrolase)